jgi:SAM-dependent methyltransferase
MDILSYNRSAWDHQVATANRWTVPVSPEVIAAARQGRWEIVLTPTLPVPAEWFPPLQDCPVLCLASGGGQQGPILAAAGARVTVFDNSPRQLEQDRLVADREGLELTTIQGDMANLSAFADETFALIVHPCSNCFVPAIRPVWREAARVLRRGGILLAGFLNPLHFLFDEEKSKQGVLEVRYSIPYSDLTSLGDRERQRYVEKQEPLAFGHSLDDQIGGQFDAGLVLTGLYEDRSPESLVARYIANFLATRAAKA